MVLRYWYLLRSSWPRLLELIYWPAVQMLMWGFLQLYIVAEPELLRARRRHLHRRCAAVGHPVPRPARLLHLVPRGDVGAQPRQPDDEPAAAGRVRRRADDHERGAACHRHGAGIAARHRRSSASISTASAGARGVLRQSDPDQLVGRHLRVRAGAAQRPRRREHSPGPSCSCSCRSPASTTRSSVLPGGCSTSPGAAADLRVRRHARAAHRPRLPRRPDAAGASRSMRFYFAAATVSLSCGCSKRPRGRAPCCRPANS